MAIEYHLDLGGPMSADTVGEVFAQTAAAQGMLDDDQHRFDRDGAVLRSHQLVSVHASEPSVYLPVVEGLFGFTPAAFVIFRVQAHDDPVEQRQDMIRLVAAVLKALAGNAWLAFGGEISRLVRLDGRVTVSADDDFWLPEVLALLPPHDRATLPNA